MFADDVYAVILAGGSGTRFWPKSRQTRPKQLCQIGDSELTMIERTLRRLDDVIPPERRIIVTHQTQVEATRKIVGDRCALLLAEPDARNTANALALAAVHLEKVAPNSVMISLHADAVIQNEGEFNRCLDQAVATAREDYLVLLGIVPTRPETGFGYIEAGSAHAGQHDRKVHDVASFREKPPLEEARRYVDQGNFFWNAGIFVWQTKRLIRELEERLPAPIKGLRPLTSDRGLAQVELSTLAAVYKELPKIAIDYAVLEVADRVAVVPADIGWQDVGSWDALAPCFGRGADGHYRRGDTIAIDAKDCTLDADSQGPMIAVVGVENLVVVSTPDAVLVCPQDRAQDVRKIVKELQEAGRNELL